MLALAFLLLGPAPASPVEPVGLVWHDKATVDAATQQRLARLVAEVAGIPASQVVADAADEARRLVAHEIDRKDVEALIDARQTLQAAAASYRAGDLDAAGGSVSEVLAALERIPTAPGAARLAFAARVLEGQIAWTRGDPTRMDAALRAAVALDPEATLSTRRVPPAFAEAFAKVRDDVLATRDRWSAPKVRPVQVGLEIEIDGVAGLRPVPPGDHFVVVRRPGMPPWGIVVTPEEEIVLPGGTEAIGPGLPASIEVAERICDAVGLGRLVLLRLREGRLGLQGYACGEGFGPVWHERPQSRTEGVAFVLGASNEAVTFDGTRERLGDEAPWPVPRIDTAPVTPQDTPPPPRPWYKRAWVWSLVGVAVVGAVTTGVVLGTRDRQAGIEVDIPSFLPPMQ